MGARNYRELTVWQKAMALVEEVYRLTRGFPSDEKFGLTNQLRRASVSVPSNIAEGQGRRSRNQFVIFLRIARGSVQEVETQLMIAQRLNYASERQVEPMLQQLDEISRLLAGLLRSMES
jgi:four helix bundle protein